ncbi:MAG: uridine kinase [Bacteroidetes bacterium]|nr:uridine kinase [Bacteroidota bacterium]
MNPILTIGISGLSGAGKTFLVRELQSRGGHSVVCLSMDDYYLPRHKQQVDENGYVNYDLPGALNLQQFVHDLRLLKAGHTVLVKKYHFELDAAPETVEIIEPAPVVLADGLFVFSEPDCFSLLDVRVFVESSTDTGLSRRLKRDELERGIDAGKSMYQWMHHVIPAYERYILPYRNQCQYCIPNAEDKPMEIQSLWEYIAAKTGLRTIPS